MRFNFDRREYTERDIPTGRAREAQLIREAEQDKSRSEHSRLLKWAAGRAAVRARLK